MTKARDISSLIGSSGQIDNTKITLDANEIPNLDTAKITTGTFADARISNSSVVQHSTPFDDNKIVNDLSTLALRQASDQNKSAYNTNSQSVDVFQDDTGIDTTTDVIRNSSEYVSSGEPTNIGDTSNLNLLLHFDNNYNDSSSNNYSPTSVGGTIVYDSNTKKFGTHSAGFDGSNDYLLYNQGDGGVWFGSGDWAYDFWYYPNANANNVNYRRILGGHQTQDSSNYHQMGFYTTTNRLHTYNDTLNTTNGINMSGWNHILVQRADGVMKIWINGTLDPTTLTVSTNFNTTNDFGLGWDGTGNAKTWGFMDEFRLCKFAPTKTAGDLLYTGDTTSNFTPPTVPYRLDTISATGNFTGTTITAPSSVSEMGAIITYQDNAGTNALNTDIVLQLSADGGSNYSTATLTALPDFSTGIKMAKVNDLAVTAGTQLKYKINFANQASGSKEARIRGVALQY